MSIVMVIVIGGVVGWLAGHLAGRHEGIFGSVAIGIIGSFIGGLLSRLVTGTDRSYLAFSWSGFFWSLIGALILVSILNALSNPRHTTT